MNKYADISKLELCCTVCGHLSIATAGQDHKKKCSECGNYEWITSVYVPALQRNLDIIVTSDNKELLLLLLKC